MATQIESVTVYRVNGFDFPSIGKAIDHIDGHIDRVLQAALLPEGFTASECFKVTKAVLSIRRELAELLDFRLPDDTDD